MKPFNREALDILLATHEAPCITICMPTHGRPPQSGQDSVKWSNAMREARAMVAQLETPARSGATDAIERLQALGDGSAEAVSGRDFWNSGRRGLAAFASPDHFSWFWVASPLRDACIVADSFHVKPLLPLVYEDSSYHVLALRRAGVQMYEGSRDHLVELSMDGIPRSLEEAVGREFDDSHQGSNFHGVAAASKARTGGAGGAGAGGAGTHFHGYGGGDREVDVDLERFFREVDRAVIETYSRPTGRPLILAAAEQHAGEYRRISHDPVLVPEGIAHDPRALTSDELREQAWAIFDPMRRKRIESAVESFGTASAHGQGSSDILAVGRAAVAGRVRRLLIEEGRRAWGRLSRETGEIALGGGEGQADTVDVLDDLAEVTLVKGGEVLLVPAGLMPAPSGIAAHYRY